MAMASMSSLAATAVKSSVASSVSGMRERRADQMSQVDWCVRAWRRGGNAP
jgi:GT2 family glycosyltransferase